MRKLFSLLFIILLSGCSSSGGDSPPQVGDTACSNDGQKQFVLDAMRDVYFWEASLPASVDLSAQPSPEALLDFLTTFSPTSATTGDPIDRFSFIRSAAADSALLGEGEFEGFGFTSRFEAADDLRFVRVFSSSPAAQAGFERGQRIVELDGRTIAEIVAAEGVNAVFDLDPLTFTIRRLDDSEFTVTVSQGLVTIDPLPQWRVIDTPTGSVGYIEFATFISTANPVFDTIFSQFRQANISDLIIDLRYNGGGLVSTTELFADYLGGMIANNLIFSKTIFNANNTASNSTSPFQQLTNSLNLSRLVIVASRNTASASEMIANGLAPFAEVVIVGDTTFGKPVGQVGVEFCSKILRPASFELLNALDEGRYFDGLPVDCPAADDSTIPVGADNDPNVETALEYFATGACPVVSGQFRPQRATEAANIPSIEWRGPAEREYAGAF